MCVHSIGFGFSQMLGGGQRCFGQCPKLLCVFLKMTVYAWPCCKSYLSMLPEECHIEHHPRSSLRNLAARSSPGREGSVIVSCRQIPPHNHHQDFPASDKRPKPAARGGAGAPFFHLPLYLTDQWPVTCDQASLKPVCPLRLCACLLKLSIG